MTEASLYIYDDSASSPLCYINRILGHPRIRITNVTDNVKNVACERKAGFYLFMSINVKKTAFGNKDHKTD